MTHYLFLTLFLGLVLVAGEASICRASSMPNDQRSYKLTVLNGFDLDAVRQCQKEKGRLFISQYAAQNVMENANWICVIGEFVYPYVGEPIVILDHRGSQP